MRRTLLNRIRSQFRLVLLIKQILPVWCDAPSVTSSTSYTSLYAAVDLSRIFPSSSFRNQTSPAGTRDGLAFEGDDASADVIVVSDKWLLRWDLSIDHLCLREPTLELAR